jgi:acetyltransferase-like isoleucine patch superfamily enzyme
MNLEEMVREKIKGVRTAPFMTPDKNSFLNKIKRHYCIMLSNLFPDIDPFFALRNKLYRFGYTGANVRVRSGMKCSNPENVFLFDEVFINYNCVILAKSEVIIGREVAIGPNVSFYTVNHKLNQEILKFSTQALPIIVGDYSWIGGNSVILPGVIIGKQTIIGAGSVVTQNTEEGGTYVGNPARKIERD